VVLFGVVVLVVLRVVGVRVDEEENDAVVVVVVVVVAGGYSAVRAAVGEVHSVAAQ
jgi:hypothetical protein